MIKILLIAYLGFGVLSSILWIIFDAIHGLKHDFWTMLGNILAITFLWAPMWFIGLYRGAKFLSWR